MVKMLLKWKKTWRGTSSPHSSCRVQCGRSFRLRTSDTCQWGTNSSMLICSACWTVLFCHGLSNKMMLLGSNGLLLLILLKIDKRFWDLSSQSQPSFFSPFFRFITLDWGICWFVPFIIDCEDISKPHLCNLFVCFNQSSCPVLMKYSP